MYTPSTLVLLLAAGAADVLAATTPVRRQFPDPIPYAPKPASCPAGGLRVRDSVGLGPLETAWLAVRQPKADAALKTWLSQFGSFPASDMPVLASSVAGGYLRASLLGAGIHQQLDNQEGTGPMSGLLQAIVYEATLSGSAAFQDGLVQNNWPSIASLSSGLWEPNYAYGMTPGAAGGTAGKAEANSGIVADVSSRFAASYPTTLIDIYGRIIGLSNMYDPRGGVNVRMSDARTMSKFANGEVPMPIMTSIGTANNATSCHPGSNGTQYEFTPFEFGSWDNGVAGFIDMKYLGTRMINGRPLTPFCTTGFDNMGLITGTTANTIAKQCSNGPDEGVNSAFDAILEAFTLGINRVYYGAYPNPFAGRAASPKVASQSELALVDGGNSGQVIPLWPLLNRDNIDVTFVWDNYYDNPATKGTTGGQIFNTYKASLIANLNRMPVIPNKAIFKSKGLFLSPQAFGCNDPTKQTFIYVPYIAYIPQTQKTGNLTTTPAQTRNLILNGNRLATNNNNAAWPKCVACLIMKKKSTNLPSFCSACFSKYCYN